MKFTDRRSFLLVSLIWLFCTYHQLRGSEAIWLSVPDSGAKCVSEEIHNNVVVMGDYFVVHDEDDHSGVEPTIAVEVTSPTGKSLHHHENATHGQFAFTTNEAGDYSACFSQDGNKKGGDLSVNLDWKTGVAAKDWDSVAKKEKIEGVEHELKRLEGIVEDIHDSLQYMRTREGEMRVVNEHTNYSVAWFSMMSLAISIVVSVMQIFYLKRYFRKKKLI
ncbi:hypothetical protein Droror1_Dr00027576 [Drosera rotundifolia]